MTKGFKGTPEAHAQELRIRRICQLAGRSLSAFCRRHPRELRYNTMQSLSSGRLRLSERMSLRLWKAVTREQLICTPKWLETGEGEPVRSASLADNIPLPLELDALAEEARILAEVSFFQQQHPSHYVSQILDDALVPLYHPGDYVGGGRQYGEDLARCLGWTCIVELKKGGTVMRHLTWQEELQSYVLSPLNTHTTAATPVLYVKQAHIVSAAPIVWHRQLFKKRIGE